MKFFYSIFLVIVSLVNISLKGQAFTNISAIQGTDVKTLSSDYEGSGVSFFDFSYDGWPDLFVVNDRNNIPWQNALYGNNWDGTFTNVSDSAGVFMDGAYPMTGSFAIEKPLPS